MPEADPEKAVKEYARSAAGQQANLPSELRPGPVLLRTMLHIVDR